MWNHVAFSGFYRYSFEGVLQAIYGFEREPLNCNEPEDNKCMFQNGDDVLRKLDVQHAKFHYDFIALCVFFVVLRIGCYIVLRWRVKVH